MQRKILLMSICDNVGIMLDDAEKGDVAIAGERSVQLVGAVKFAHKVALRIIAKGEPVVKYGEVIGNAVSDISEGEWVHVHNLDDAESRQERLQ